jgi:hypothetical protein
MHLKCFDDLLEIHEFPLPCIFKDYLNN